MTPTTGKGAIDKRARRTVIIDFGFTAKEEERIADRAAQFGLTPEEYLRARPHLEP
jgi:phosphate uptake regulator